MCHLKEYRLILWNKNRKIRVNNKGGGAKMCIDGVGVIRGQSGTNKSLGRFSNSFSFFTLEDIYNYCFLNAHDVTDKEHQLLPTEL
jgi:hypothetical protein